ncbi:hypothetical protein [Mesorhizobium sp. CN2-181]|uniref:hypothetical protein n=1 Tax=Mesorhizobium yinganensis TaxID=3157707 RepID=UPI0032B714DE
MAQLTWRNVDVPVLPGADSRRYAGVALQDGLDTLSKALSNIEARQQQNAVGVSAQDLLRFSNAGDLDAYVASGAIDPRAMRDESFRNLVANRRGQLLDGDFRQVQTEGQRLSNQGIGLANENQAQANSQQLWDNNRIRGYEVNRPAAVQLQADVRARIAAGDYTGAAQLQRAGAGKLAAAGVSIDGIGTIDDNNTAAAGSRITLNENIQKEQIRNEEFNRTKQVDGLINERLKQYGTPELATSSILEDPKLDYKTKQLAVAGIGGIQELFGPQVGLEDALASREINRELARRSGQGGGSLINLVDAKEGAGRYDTLFGHAQAKSGPMAGVDVSKMTIGQLGQFASADGAYGRHQKNQLGYLATPMGRFQIVGSTLQATAKEMGLSPDTVFDENTQNAMFAHLVQKRLSGPRTMQGKIDGLRQEWEGFKSVPDNALAQAITAWESGDRGSLGNLTQGGGTQDNSTAAGILANQTRSNQSLIASYGSSQGDQADVDLLNNTNLQVNRAASVMDRINIDSALDPTAAITDAFINSPDAKKPAADLAKEVHSAIGDDDGLPLDQIEDEINVLKDRYHVRPDIAAAILKSSIQETSWGANYFLGDRNASRSRMDDYAGQFLDISTGRLDVNSPKVTGVLSKMETIRSQRASGDKIQNLISQVQANQEQYARSLNSGKSGGREKARLTYETSLRRLQAAIDAADGNPANFPNTGVGQSPASAALSQATRQAPEQGTITNIGSANRGSQGTVIESRADRAIRQVATQPRQASQPNPRASAYVTEAYQDVRTGADPRTVARRLEAAGVPRKDWPANLVRALNR